MREHFIKRIPFYFVDFVCGQGRKRPDGVFSGPEPWMANVRGPVVCEVMAQSPEIQEGAVEMRSIHSVLLWISLIPCFCGFRSFRASAHFVSSEY